VDLARLVSSVSLKGGLIHPMAGPPKKTNRFPPFLTLPRRLSGDTGEENPEILSQPPRRSWLRLGSRTGGVDCFRAGSGHARPPRSRRRSDRVRIRSAMNKRSSHLDGMPPSP